MPATASGTAGQRLTRQLGLSSDWVIGPRRLAAVADPVEAVRSALAQPLAFPPLVDCTAPGDRGAIAMAGGVPQTEQLVRGAVQGMMDADIDPENISVVLETELPTLETLRQELLETTGVDIRIEVHRPEQETACAMLGVTAAGRALRINRTLTDADVVLPISVAQPRTDPTTQAGRFAALLPGFSDEATQRRFRKAEARVNAARSQAHAAEVDEAGWLMGVMFTLQATPGPDDTLLGVFAGEPQAAADAAAGLAAEAWTTQSSATADLVVAVVGDHPAGDSWRRVEHALMAAEPYRKQNGAIVVCIDSLDRPRGALRRLIDDDDYPRLEAELREIDLPHTGAALQLAAALEQGSVYLRSPLAPTEVESLGMTPVGADRELERLVARFDRCLILDQADRLMPVGADG